MNLKWLQFCLLLFFYQVEILALTFPCDNPTKPNAGGYGISSVALRGKVPSLPQFFINSTPRGEGFTREYDSIGVINVNACQEYWVDVAVPGIGTVWVWLDRNGDGDFDDFEEKVYSQNIFFGTAYVPLITACGTAGDTLLMRVATKSGTGSTMSPCDSLLTGDVEDYLLVVGPSTAPIPPTFDTSGTCAYKNLVLNPSFEKICCCPWALSQLYFAHDVTNPTIATPEVYSSCATTTTSAVPTNQLGYQQARTGNNYSGLLAYEFGSDWHEYIQMDLSAPLVASRSYYFEAFINLADVSKYSIDEFGVYFSATQVQQNIATELPLVPQLTFLSATPYDDTTNWVKLSGVYTPTVSGEQHLVIGNFNSVAASNITTNGFGVDNYAYYFVDDVLLIPEPEFPIAAFDNTICIGDSILLSMNAHCKNNWIELRDTTDTLSTANGIYARGDSVGLFQYVISANDGGCLWIKDTFNITVVANPTLTVSSDDTICAGESITLSASGGTAYYWSTGQTTNSINVSPTSQTTYSVITGQLGCTDNGVVSIVVNSSPTINVGSQNNLCAGQAIGAATVTPVSGTAPYTYSWSNSQSTQIASGLTTGTYSVNVFDSTGCVTTATISITEPSALSLSFNGDSSICKNDSTVINAIATGGIGPYLYNWSNGNTNQSILVTPSTTTTYSLNISDANGCTTMVSRKVTINNPQLPFARPDTSITKGGMVQLISNAGNAYLWSPDSSLSCTACKDPIANPSQTTTYYLQFTDSNGCYAMDSLTIIVVEENDSCLPPYLPTAFSPNNDGQNDLLQLYGQQNLSYFQLTIYNRWGEVIFESSDPGFVWDGEYRNKPSNTLVHTYLMQYKCEDIEQAIKGNITIVR